MDKSGMFGEILEQGHTAAKNVRKQIADTAKAAGSQLTGIGQGGQNQGAPKTTVDRNFVKDLYGIKDETNQTQQKFQGNKTTNKQPQINPEQVSDPKKMEEKQKLQKLRQELHMETYYKPTFNPPKKQEERAAEKVENEKKKEEFELQKKEEEKPKPIAVQRAQRTAEMNRGVSG